MKNEFDKKQNLSQPSVRLQNRGLELSPRQAEIYRNLEAIGPEIAAFYLSGVRMLQNDDLEASSYLLAHTAREIEGGLRDILSSPQNKQKIQKQLKKEELGDLEDRIGHIASILDALGIEDLQAPISRRWIGVATEFHRFAHRQGAWESPRSKEVFVPLWREFENVLVELVGTHFKLLDRLDRILDHKQPTEKILKTLPNLLASEVRYAYFFNRLDFPAWLKPLKDAGWFHPDRQPTSHEVPDRPVHFWHALEYIEKVANHTKESPCEETFDLLADIVNAIVDLTNSTGKSITSDHTESQIIKIICALPIERIELRHITFIGISLRSRAESPLMGSTIGETMLPKLLNGGAKELTLVLLEYMLDAEVIHRNIRAVMGEYWLSKALQKHWQAIAELCGVEAAKIACAQIRALINEGAYSFNIISKIDNAPSDFPHQRYAKLLVGFTSGLLRSVKFDSGIEEIVRDLLHEGLAVTCNDPIKKDARAIFGRIALSAIAYHYEDLKRLFWNWQGNPLNETFLKPEIYQLLQANCLVFDEDEIDRVLHWIESQQYIKEAEDDNLRAKQVAYRKREWLSALLETGNQKVVSASEKYKQINSAEIDHPGFLWRTETSYGETSPLTVETLSDMSNGRIAEYLVEFKENNISLSAPTERGLAQTLEECVKTNPQRFTADLPPFQSVGALYQCSILSGLLTAWHDKKEFNWATLLEFIHQILASERFWNEEDKTGLNYRDWVFSVVADLVTAGTKNDKYAFDVQLLPLAEEILLILVGKVGKEGIVIAGPIVDLLLTFLNSVKGKTFTAMINYALRFARTHNIEQDSRWPIAIKRDFTKRLDRNIENSIGFSFALGAYLPNLLYLDKEWVISNIDNIFPQQDKDYWQVAFSGYLYYANIHEELYYLLKARGHYQKALNIDFADTEIQERLVAHVCTSWIEDSESLNDKTSLIYQLINSDNPNLLSVLIHFFWRQRDNLSPKMQSKVMLTWRALYESLSQKDDVEKYREVLSRLSGWVALTDTIDAEVLKWLKMSTKYITGVTDSAFFVEELLPHARKTPREVGEIYLGMLMHNIYPYHDQEHIQGIVRVLYSTGHTEAADRICNLYGEAGFDFLRSLYDGNQN